MTVNTFSFVLAEPESPNVTGSWKVENGEMVVHGPGPRQSALDHIESAWTDMRPKSLVEQMERDERARAAAQG